MRYGAPVRIAPRWRLDTAGGAHPRCKARAVRRTVRIFTLVDKRYVEVEPANERLASIVIPGLVVDPAALFAELDAMFPDESDEEEADAPEA